METDVFFKPNCVEYFRNPKTFEVFFIRGMQTLPFSEITIDDATALRQELDRFPEKIKALERAGVNDPFDQLEVFAGCAFGNISQRPDFINGKRKNTSLTPCHFRGSGNCPYSEVICDKGRLIMPDGTVINPAEIRALNDAKNDLSEKQSSTLHKISTNTIRKVKMNLRDKLGLKTTAGLAAFAVRHGI